MSWSWTLSRYLARHFVAGVLTAYGALLVLALSIDIVDLLGRTGGRLGILAVVGMAFLQLADLGQKMLPFAVLGGGVFAFARLSRSQELVASRAAGVSAWEFLVPPIAVAVLIGVFAVVAFTPVSSRMLAEFAALEARYVKGEASQLAISENGLWLRQGDRERQAVIHALRVSQQGEHLEDVVVFRYAGTDSFVGRIDAHSAQLSPGAWRLRDAWVSGADGATAPVHHDSFDLPTTLTPAQIQESFASPETLSFWDLPGYIRAAKAAGFSGTRYELYFYSLLTLPLLFGAMVLMAASFSMHMSPRGGLFKAVLASLLAGFGVYFFTVLSRTLGQSGILPVLLAATAPAAATILIGMTLVFHQEDG